MEHEQKSCGSGSFYSFVGGVIFGGILGFLFAPMSGQETRQNIHEKYDEVKEKLKKLEDKFAKHEEETPLPPDTE